MKVLRNILESEKTNIGKLELVKLLEDAIVLYGESMKLAPSIEIADNVFILSNLTSAIQISKFMWLSGELYVTFVEYNLGNIFIINNLFVAEYRR